jgi:tetratricopeptide (TPR) repeat protein
LLENFNGWIERNAVAAQALLAGIALVVFSGTLANGFVYDDNPQIIQNPFIINPDLWKKMFSGSVWSFQGAATNFYRPLQFVCYWLLYRLAGPNPVPFHLLNLLLYTATVVLVYRLGLRLASNGLVAFGGALLWALHPVHVEAVAWISCLPDIGCGFFCLIAFLLFLRAEVEGKDQLRLTVLSALALLSALFFKEMALGFPLLLITWWFFLGRPESWLRRTSRWAPYLLAVALYVIARHFALGYFSETSHFWRLNRVVVGSALGLLGDHARILLWPRHLSVYRMFNLRASLLSVWPWATLAVILSTLWIRKRDPRLAFLIAWWPVSLLPVLDIRQLSFPQLADRFNYFPSIGPCLAIACVALEWLPARARKVELQVAVAAALALAGIAFGVETARYIPRWYNNDTLINYSLRQSPNSPLLHMARGMELEYQDGNLDGAMREYKTAWRLNQKSTWPLGLAHDYYLAMGRIALRRGHRNQAIRDFKKVIQVAPTAYSDATDALGAIYFPDGDYAKAATYFAESVKLNPQDLGARFYLGTCWMQLKHYHQAAAQFRAARKTAPDYRQAYQAEARALEAAGDTAGAARVRREIPK